ncbi:hypothetical protein D187_009717 [Cystobacter fuscus DSM 2262]|uniref:Uncharacterized protein n=1 Tax=Cystobacter fuscus (strain ATCC 25194 / DSM 2262 / NBRC 100088 / M29) TaxID=1242864 RepID=S9QF47_CYSF2|nr:hypothetical protein [Cystobacter fuscus]EPX54978.1 hypothetical protein D187_009717 [Cystobacter fuscus DSM 2262]
MSRHSFKAAFLCGVLSLGFGGSTSVFASDVQAEQSQKALRVTFLMYSGRPNPSVTVTDPEQVRAIEDLPQAGAEERSVTRPQGGAEEASVVPEAGARQERRKERTPPGDFRGAAAQDIRGGRASPASGVEAGGGCWRT